MAAGYTNLADLARARGRLAEARDGYDRAIALRERLARDHPETPSYRSELADSHRRRGLAQAGPGRPVRRRGRRPAGAGALDGLPSRSGEEWFESACARAALAGLAGRAGSGVPAAEGRHEADAAMARCTRRSRWATTALDAYRNEDALDPLRNREDFRLLMMDLAFPEPVFARGE